jgi:hypothetical protein
MVVGRRSTSPGFPGAIGTYGCAVVSAQRNFVYPGILPHLGHSLLEPPPNFPENVRHEIPGVSFARIISSRESSNGVTPALVNISAKGTQLVDALGPRREVDADGTGAFLCSALLWLSAMLDTSLTLQELTQVRARLQMHLERIMRTGQQVEY